MGTAHQVFPATSSYSTKRRSVQQQVLGNCSVVDLFARQQHIASVRLLRLARAAVQLHHEVLALPLFHMRCSLQTHTGSIMERNSINVCLRRGVGPTCAPALTV